MVAPKGQEEHRSGHGPLVPAPGFRPSQARWAHEPDGRAVVFVHGFNGKAVGTWKGPSHSNEQAPRIVCGLADVVMVRFSAIGTRRRVLFETATLATRVPNGARPPR